MTWDRTQPTDTTKIRNLGIVIRPNWEAIEDGDSSFQPQAINYANRTPLAAANDPTAISTSYITYCKDDVDGNPELFGIDASGKISQFTINAGISAQDGYTMLAPDLLLQWGRRLVTTPAGGSFTITFSRAFSVTPYSVVMTIYAQPTSDSSRGFGIQTIGSLTTTGFTAQNFNSGVPAGTTMGWMAIGPL